MTAPVARVSALLLILAACNKATPMRAGAVAAESGPQPTDAAVMDTTSAVELTPAPSAVSGGAAGVAREATMPDRAKVASTRLPTEEVSLGPASVGEDVQPGSMLVRVGTASLQVDSLDLGVARIREIARRVDAIVANTQMEGGRDETRSASLQLRIPSEHFDEAVKALPPVGKLESVNVNVQDVGEEFVDVQARVANARRLEQRLVELLASRTGKLADVLSVERELARVREEIERYEGRMRYLRSRASVSTLTISVHEAYPVVADRPGANPIGDAFIQAWRNLVGFTAGFIELLGVLIPVGAIGVGVVLLVRRFIPNVMPRFAPGKATGLGGGA